MTNNIEDTIFDNGLATNLTAMFNRGMEIMNETERDTKLKRLAWLINATIHGQLCTIDMSKEWDRLNEQHNNQP